MTNNSTNNSTDIIDPSTDEIYRKNKIYQSQVDKILTNAMNLFPTNNDKILGNKALSYILRECIGSGKNQRIERYINSLSIVSREIKYLINNSKNSLEANLKEIEKQRTSFEEYKKKGLEYSKTNNVKNTSRIKKQWEFFKDNVIGLKSGIVNFFGIPESARTKMRNMISIGEKYIGKPYQKGIMDCSMFVSILICAFQGKKPTRILTSSTVQKYLEIKNINDVLAGTIMWFPGHIEMIVGKLITINGKKYFPTFGSSTDTDRVDPMYDANGNPIKGKNGVGYRLREAYPRPRHDYKYYKPPEFT